MDGNEPINFERLAQSLLSRIREILPNWLSGGRIVGHEYTCGSIQGGPGDSCKVNLNTGKWADFASTGKGGDLISLYAAIKGVSQIESAKELSGEFVSVISSLNSPKVKEVKIIRPPEDVFLPDMCHFKYGKPVASWCYKDLNSKPMFFVARYDTPEGKQFLPWTWSSEGRWICKAWPKPRILYGLPDLKAHPERPVLIVEGEKCADMAKAIVGNRYVVVTWPNGAKAVQKADWRVLSGRNILIWPDADEPGRNAAKQIANILSITCPQIKIINTEGRPEGWDAADSDFSWEEFYEWAKPRFTIFNAVNVPMVQAIAVAQSKDSAPATATVQVNVNSDIDIISGSLFSIWQKLCIVISLNGQPVCNIDNALRILEEWPEFKGAIWFDEFHQKFFTTYQSDKIKEWDNEDDIKLTVFMQRTLGIRRISDETVNKAMRVYAKHYTRNEPKDWMETLVWDQKPRIGTFLIDCAQAADNDYTRAVSRNFWIAMVARVNSPGCKVDNVPILEGPQGSLKSTLWATVGGHWHCEAAESVTSKDFYQALTGKLIVEFAELSSFPKAEVTKIKQIITCKSDRYRAPYARVAEDHPRMSIFVGTTNDSIYLRDDTGARRFWPIKTGSIDIPRIQAEREQLFAEAVYLFKNGATWWEMPPSTQDEQEERRQVDPWESKILNYIETKHQVTTNEILDFCLQIEAGKQTKFDEMRVGNILKLLGWERKKKRFGKVTKWVYLPTTIIVEEEE